MLLSEGERTGVGASVSFVRILKSREGPMGDLDITVDERNWEGETH